MATPSATSVTATSSSDSALELISRRGDRLIQIALLSYFGFGLAIAPFYDTWLIALSSGSLCLGSYYLTKLLVPAGQLHRYVVSAVLALFMAQFIYQMHGMFEMHFFAFVSCVLLITYQNWKLQIPLFLIVVLHHATLAWLQSLGYKEQVRFSQLAHTDLTAFLFHTGLAGVIIGICGLWAHYLRQATLANAQVTFQLQRQLENMDRSIFFADEMGRGNLNVNYEVPEGDELGKSLLRMRESLLVASQKEEEEGFKSQGVAEVSEILRSHAESLPKLAARLTAHLTQYLGAQQGGLFLIHGEGEQRYLQLTGCYAYQRNKFMHKRIEWGEGLLGQCVIDQDTLYLTDLPENYAAISSGLGTARPRNLVLVPLKTNDEVVGVLEVASLDVLEPYKVEFLEKAGEIIAASIATTRINQRNQELLMEFQAMNRERAGQNP